MNKTGILILAAGSSSRMGQPKQLLSYQHKTLLANTIESAKSAADGIVLVILGGNHMLVAEQLTADDILYNEGWEEGISSSIRIGLAEMIKRYPALDQVILSVCDQPFITEKIFKSLIKEAEIPGKSIVASSYLGTIGTPVLFDKKHFGDLAVLKGKEGAKIILNKFKEQVASVPFEKGEIDIDTPDDYNRLINSQ